MAGTEREISGTTTRLVVRHVRARAGEDGVRRLLGLAGATEDAGLEDERRWFAHDLKLALLEAAAVVLDDPEVGVRIGESLLGEKVGAALKILVRAFGSPERMMREIARTAPKMCTSATMRTHEVGPTSAVVSYRVEAGFRPSRLDCDYTRGLLSQVGPLFGLPPAVVRHDECQVAGAERCVYAVSWRRRSRLPWRARRAENDELRVRLAAVTERLAELQSSTADLVSASDVDAVLARTAARAASAVGAPRHLLAVRAGDGPEPVVHAEGFDAAEARRLAAELLAGGPLDGPAGSRLVVDVASAQRHHGRLAAFLPDGQEFFPEERDLLAAYARHAAAALDAATAVEEARHQGETAAVLLDLAHRLAEATSVGDAARRLAAAVPAVVGADRSIAFLWDRVAETATVAGTHGWPEHLDEALQALVLRPSDTPEIARMLDSPGPRFFERTTSDEFVGAVMAAFGGVAIAVVPVAARGEVLGVVVADWAEGSHVPPFDAALAERLAGLADQGASAIAGARLVEQATHQARHDPLTGLANRALLLERTEAALAAARRRERPVAVLLVDLDGFKTVNDSLGHAAGDRVLVAAAERVRAVLRPGDTAARLGGDEFAVVVVDPGGAAGAQAVAERVGAALRAPLRVEGHEVRVDASVGVALSSADGAEVQDAPALLRDADVAMYRAKAAGKGRTELFEPTMHAAALARLGVEADLRRAVERRELVVAYQPIVELASGRTVGVEALVRWCHPTRGLVAPGEFLAAAEDTGLVVPIGRLVLAEASTQARRWQLALGPGEPALSLSVNLSARQLHEPGLATDVAEVLAAAGLAPSSLVLEVPESALERDPVAAAATLRALRALGARIAVDDFGTGRSSLTSLRRFPVDEVKIDRAVVDGVAGGPGGPALAEAVARTAAALGLRAVAEGVERAEQVGPLRRMGCELGQGFHFARPLPAEDLGPLLLAAAAARRALAGPGARP